MIYAMSDIHGCNSALSQALRSLDGRLTGEDTIVFLGDYIDYGPESARTLAQIRQIQRSYEENRLCRKVVVLRGNHEADFLDWLDTYGGPHADEPDEYGLPRWNEWLMTDADAGYNTLRTLIPGRWAFFRAAAATLSEDSLNVEAARVVLEERDDLIQWLRRLPYFYETEHQIFVHAGIDEESEELWPWSTAESTFVGKYPATIGRFYKDIIAGHIGTASLAGDPDFHGVWHDGANHWYIDGTVTVSSRIPILAYNEETGEYREL